MMNVDEYLKRINYTGSLRVDAETLRNLQLAHLRNVPFENLSIHAGEPIVLNDEALFAKIVSNRRGGFCYELNGLFSWLLRTLGFDVFMLAAGVANREDGYGPEFDHMALMVNLEQRWLADVGFGDSFVEPLLLDEDGIQQQGTQAFRIVPDDSHLIVMRRDTDQEWKPQYRFTLQTYNYADYEEMCRFHQKSPESHFTKSRICSRATLDGRITLSGLRLITTSKQERDERALRSEDEFESVLREQFGIVMNRTRAVN
jgi:N-hydroxyarylamine O-acetyltransferase